LSLRFLSPLNPATETIVANQNQPPLQNFAAPPVDTWTNYPPDAGAPAVNLPDAPVQQQPRQPKNRRTPQQSPPSLREDDQDYNIQENAGDGWAQPRNNSNRNSGNNNNSGINNNGGRRGGRGGRGRRGGRGGRRNSEYVPAGEYREEQYQQDAHQDVQHGVPSTNFPPQQNQQKNQKQFKVKQPLSDIPLDASPVAPTEPQTQNQQGQQPKKNNNQKRPINNNKPKSPPQQQSNTQSPAPVVDEYEIIVSHLKTKDPKIKFRIPAEQQPNFLKDIEAWLPAN